MPDITYIDKFITDGQKEVIAPRNLYDTILVGDSNDDTSIYRIGLNDFFLKHHDELEDITQWYSLPQQMFYKPKLLSLQLYGTTELWLSILRANNMKNTTEFHLPVIKVYQPEGLTEMIKVFFKREKKY